MALDGMRATLQLFLAKLGEKRPGDTFNLTLFRDDELRSFALKLGKRVVTDYRIAPVKQPTPEQTRQRGAWLGS